MAGQVELAQAAPLAPFAQLRADGWDVVHGFHDIAAAARAAMTCQVMAAFQRSTSLRPKGATASAWASVTAQITGQRGA